MTEKMKNFQFCTVTFLDSMSLNNIFTLPRTLIGSPIVLFTTKIQVSGSAGQLSNLFVRDLVALQLLMSIIEHLLVKTV